MTTDLRLRRLLGPQPGGAVALVFGRTTGPVEPPLPDPSPGLLRFVARAPWSRAATASPHALAGPWRAAGQSTAAWVATWAFGAPAARSSMAPWQAAQAGPRGLLGLPWQRTGVLGAQWAAPWRSTGRAKVSWQAGWAEARLTQAWTGLPWRPGAGTVIPTRAIWAPGRGVSFPWAASASRAAPNYRITGAPWQAGRPIVSYGGPVVVVTPPAPTPCWVPEPGDSVDLVLRLALRRLGDLVLACRRAAIRLVPVRRVYMVTNVTSLRRVSDNASIPCLGFSLSLDVDSWAWGFSASVEADALALLEPDEDGTPVELAAWVNGTEFRVFPEAMSRERTFGRAGVRLQGRGKTAVLDAPISAITTFSASSALTSQQLLDQALPSGWTADFGLDPWLVPGGVWSHQGTPITAAVAIAQAGGGYVQPHASASSISVLPLYPVAPWNWGSVTPDIELPASFATREAIEWTEAPRHNRVYVSGTVAGVLGRVTRTGSAGDVLAPMVTDALITTVGAARQRGLPVLAATGRRAFVTLRMPVAEGTGVIRPGAFVRYVDGALARLGLARSVAVDVQGAQVWQSVKLETFV